MVILSDTRITESQIAKYRILKESKPGLGNIGVGISDLEGLNYCPFLVTQSSGKFVCLYTHRSRGGVNLSEVGSSDKVARQIKRIRFDTPNPG